MNSHSYFLLLGSNLNEPHQQLERARFRILEIGTIEKVSGIYQSAPWGKLDQNHFLNQVIYISSNLSPHLMLDSLKQIELRMGRQRLEKWGARIIDIDILYADELQIQTDELTIPHPEIQNRKFTLVPLCDIAPEFVHPKLKKTNFQLLEQCADTLSVERYILDTST